MRVVVMVALAVIAVLVADVSYILAQSQDSEGVGNTPADVASKLRHSQPQPPETPQASNSGRDEEPMVVTVQGGDSLGKIARKHPAVTPCDIFDANPVLEDPNVVHEGQTLKVPSGPDNLPERPCPQPPPEPESESDSEHQPARASVQRVSGSSVWDRLAQCESSGDWTVNTGNGFYGGLQFHPQTWASFGGHAYAPNAHLATRQEEIVIAERVLASQGWKAWPSCSRQLGLR